MQWTEEFRDPKSWSERLGRWLARGYWSALKDSMRELQRRNAALNEAVHGLNERLTQCDLRRSHLAEQLASAERKMRAAEEAENASPELEQLREHMHELEEAEHKPTKPVVAAFVHQYRDEAREFYGREAERFAELKYRQLKQHVQHLKAEIHPSESSAYLECLELFEQIPQLRHIATRYLHDQDKAAIAHDVRNLLDRVPWLRKMAMQDPMGIRLIGDPARDDKA